MVLLSRSFATFASLLSFTLSVRATDYVIVGGGTAGLVLANRLTEDPSKSVLVLEAGGDGLGNANISSLALVGAAWGTQVDWQFPILPLAHANGRSLGVVPRGKVLGGSSAINGAYFIRGDARDYDQWEVLGNTGWNSDSLLAASFKNEEFFAPTASENIVFSADAHGTNGLLATSYQGDASPIQRSIMDSFGNSGGFVSQDVSGGNITGISHITNARLPSNATRSTSATGYYFPFTYRQNLQVELFANVDKIIWESTGDDAVAAGVQYTDQNGNVKVVNATTVILAGGTYGSPAILERSGVGSKSLLASLGIDSVVDLPMVGENLQEQPGALLSFTLNASIPLEELQPLLVGFESLQTSLSDADGSTLESLFVKPDNMPDALFAWFKNLYNANTPWVEQAIVTTTSGTENTTVSWIAGNLRPLSLGSSHITTTDHAVLPAVDYNWFASDFDAYVGAVAVARALHVVSTPPLSDFIIAQNSPPANITTIEGLQDFVRSTAFGSNHPVGTAFMGPKEIGGVVDTNLKVYGTSNVYVIDASVIPVEPAGHTQATVYAIAERAAGLFTQ